MPDLLTVGAQATQLYKTALGTVSNNIANLNSEGYSRQSVTISENAPIEIGSTFVGAGSVLTQISRAYNGFAETNLRHSSSDLNNQQPMIDYGNRIIDIFGSETSGLTSSLDRFYTASANLSTDAASQPLRNIFLSEAESLATNFRDLAGHLDTISGESQADIEFQISKLNDLSQQVVVINAQLDRKVSVTDQPPALLDQRDQLLREISELVKIDVRERPSGAVEVRLDSNSGAVVVNGAKNNTFSAIFEVNDAGQVEIVANTNGNSKVTVAFTGGTIGGLLNFRSQILAPAQADLDILAKTIVTEVNAIQMTGVDLNGDRGTALFDIDSTVGAAGMTVLQTDPFKIAAAGLLRITNNAANSGTASIDYQAPPANVATPANFTLTYSAGVGYSDGATNYNPDANGQFVYAGITFTVKGIPADGDSFDIGLNTNSDGDNRNIALVAQLQNKSVLSDGNSISEGYAAIVSRAGSRISLAIISQEAIQVIYDQAVQTRDEVSGVNLDEEAADLIRFQQAFQASAQIIQTASKLFDSILAVR
jgi:flagellar hook-associated protein FlgK